MMNLYKIADAYLHILHNLENIPDDDLAGKLEELNVHYANFEDTAVNMAAYIKNLLAEEEAVRHALNQFEERAASLERRIERLKEFLHGQMMNLSIPKIIKDPMHKLHLRTNPPSVQIDDLHQVPDDYFDVKEVKYLSKEKLKERLQTGETIPGCKLVQKTRLQII